MNVFKLRITILLLPVLFFVNCSNRNTTVMELVSPDKAIKVTVIYGKSDAGKAVLEYNIVRFEHGKKIQVLENSALGILRSDQAFVENLTLINQSAEVKINDTYEMKTGRQSKILNLANEKILTFKNENGALLQLVFRAYNDGVAFKYVFPESSEAKFTVVEEQTAFKVPLNGQCWIQPYDKPSQWAPGYELYYQNAIPVGTLSPNKEGWAFPALFQTNNSWILISEANLTASYAGIRLQQNADNGLYKVRFPDSLDGEGVGDVNPVSTLPWDMPWRFITIGASLSDIYKSQMVNNLSEAPAMKDFSWVKPGRSSWSWISAPDSPRDYNALKKFVDLSAEMHWEYSLVDANWETMKNGTLEQLICYAAQKGVGILVWYNSGGPNNVVTEGPRDLMTDRDVRRAEFRKLQQWGAKGIKVDFWHSDKQLTIQQYIDLLNDAADFNILVNLHGCTIPRGWSRTYPNLLTLESVKGAENFMFDSTYTANAPLQNTILPFTRNVIGPMDYTPLVLRGLKYPSLSTYAHELALTIVFNSGIQHIAEHEEVLRQLPVFVIDFLKTVPVSFDETQLLTGFPGKELVTASRKGNKWYIAGINGENKAKDFELELPFSKGNYTLNTISDGAGGRSFENTTAAYSAGEKLRISMLPYGGFVIVLSELN
jgi:hypothetical protein